MEMRRKKENGSRKCEFHGEHSKCCNIVDHWRPLEKAIVTKVLKNDSAFVAAEEIICERINIESTNKFRITEW